MKIVIENTKSESRVEVTHEHGAYFVQLFDRDKTWPAIPYYGKTAEEYAVRKANQLIGIESI